MTNCSNSENPLEQLLELERIKNETELVTYGKLTDVALEKYKSLKQQIEKALEITKQIPKGQDGLGNNCVSIRQVYLNTLEQNQRTEQDKQNVDKILNEKNLIGHLLYVISECGYTGDEVMSLLRDTYKNLPEDKTTKQNEQIVQKAKDSLANTESNIRCSDGNIQEHFITLRDELQQILGEEKK